LHSIAAISNFNLVWRKRNYLRLPDEADNRGTRNRREYLLYKTISQSYIFTVQDDGWG
jgi:hypothetical protein